MNTDATVEDVERSKQQKSAPKPTTNESILHPYITGATHVMAIIGDPIEQARTPEAINPAFNEIGANIVCVPMRICASQLETAINGLKSIRNVVGFSVTIPHKAAVVRFCDSLDCQARRVGAVNLVRRERDGAFRGYQFDGLGFVSGLHANGFQVRERDCLVLGAGGAAAAIAFALVDAGANRIRVANRTRARAEQLVDRINSQIGRLISEVGDPVAKDNQLVVNATSLGMEATDPLPLDSTKLNATMIVAEAVAKYETTNLLRRAADQGAATHSGIHMVNHQVGLMAEHLKESLDARTDAGSI